jgi:integrase
MGLQLASQKTSMERFEEGMVNLSDKTKKLYLRHLHEYCNYIVQTPEQLYQFEQKAWSSRNNVDLLTVPNSVKKYMNYLVNQKGKAPGTASTTAKAVTKFMRTNGFDFFKINEKPKSDTKGQKIISKEQIKELYDLSGWSDRLRALLMVMKDTGLRVSDIAELSCEDYWNAKEVSNDHGERFKIWTTQTTTKKSKVNAHIHLGPESIRCIEKYIGQRRNGHIFLTERSMPHKTDDGSTQPGEPMKGINITTVIRWACKPLREEGSKISAHSFRKFFLHEWTGAGFKDHGKLLAGKKIAATDESYIWAWEDGTLSKKYIELYDRIRVLGPNREIHEKRIDQLEIQLDHANRTSAELKQEADAQLKTMSDAFEKRVQELQNQFNERIHQVENRKNIELLIDEVEKKAVLREREEQD